MDFSRLQEIADKRGTSLSFLSTSIGRYRTFLRDVKFEKSHIDYESLKKLADILGTTAAYLNGETDNPYIPEKVDAEDLLDESTKAITAIFALLNEEKKKAEASIDLGAYVALYDVPHLSLACTSMTFHSHLVIRMYLYGEILT